MIRNARSYATAAAVAVGIHVGAAGLASAAEPLEARLVPDPLATNSATFILRNVTNPDCEPDCPTATTDVELSETSWVDASFHRDTTELTLLDAFLEVPDFELGFGPVLKVQVKNVSVVRDPGFDPPVAVIGSNSDLFDVLLRGLINAEVTAFGQALPPFVDEPGGVPVAGTFTFDPVLGTFALTNVGGIIAPDPIEELGFVFELTGEVDLNFIATGVLDVFGEDFENGDFGGWASVVPTPI